MHRLNLHLLVKAHILELHEEAARDGRTRLARHADERSLSGRARRALGGVLIRLGRRLHGEHRLPEVVAFAQAPDLDTRR